MARCLFATSREASGGFFFWRVEGVKSRPMRFHRIIFACVLVAIGSIIHGCDESSPANGPAASPAKAAAAGPSATAAAPPAASQQSPSVAAGPSAPPPPPSTTPSPPPGGTATAPGRPVDASIPPQITFDHLIHDFGVISEVQPVTAIFNFTNTGGQTLVIEKVKTSCTCTTAGLTKTKYQPGESGKIEVTFTPTGPGRDPRLVNVISNSAPTPGNPEDFVRLQIHSEVLPFLDIQPRFLDVGVLAYRQAHGLTVSVACPSDENFTIEAIRTSNPHFSAQLRPVFGGEKKRIVVITIEPTAMWGSLFSWLEITGKGRPAPNAEPIVHTSKIRIQGQIFGQLKAEPDTFRFGAKPGEQFMRSVRVTRTDGQPFELSATLGFADLPGTVIRVQRLSPSSYDLIMTATGDQLRPTAGGTVAVTTNVPGEEKIDIPIMGVIRVDNPSPQ